MGLRYRLLRRLVRSIVRPQATGHDHLATDRAVYVIDHRSLADLLVTDIVCEAHGLASPMACVEVGDQTEPHRFFFLNRASGFIVRRNTMMTYSERLLRLKDAALADPALDISLIPVSVFWGRAPSKEKSLIRMLFSESWAVTSGLRRLLGMFVNRTRILVHYGTPRALGDLVSNVESENLATRRIARVLRVSLRNQRVAALGPDFSHRRTLTEQIVTSRQVTAAIETLAESGTPATRLRRRAHKHAVNVASNMTYTTIRVLERLLTWFWNRIYSGVDVRGIDALQRYSETHTVVLTPSHRSHIDYLLLSYTLFNHGLVIPHIAAGDNLNLPVLGAILRRGGAFFMRRSFRDDPLYYAVFSEYLYQVYRRGHTVEFFIEGGRSRTGRLLAARTGLLQMTIEHHQRGIPRPIVFVPVYFGYEKLIEAGSYLDELRGATKQRERLRDLLGSLKLVRRDFGTVSVNFAEPLELSAFLETNPGEPRDQAQALGDELLTRVNSAADINAINLVAMIMLSMPKLAMDETLLVEQLRCYAELLDGSGYTPTGMAPEQIVRYAERLDLLDREPYPGGDIMTLTNQNAVLATWYRNNVMHSLVVPALISALISGRRRPLREQTLLRMVDVIYPYLRDELKSATNPNTRHWIERMQAMDLLVRPAPGLLATPSVEGNAFYRLRTLSLLIVPTLERYYIVIGLLTELTDGVTADQLVDRCQSLAERMSRLFGLNAPEFFDVRLFRQFINMLIGRGAVSMAQDGTLVPTAVVRDVVRRADRVVSADFRQAVFRAGAANAS